ncbi:MAG: hypothetical protein HYV17_11395 [Xanthomonadales bacterium]|nr:hypothetical protein [Xanthomonadales bacterium]
MNTSAAPLRAWHSMSARDHAVWGAAYALHPNPGLEAAAHADRVVDTLSGVDWPETEEPEHRAARLIRGLSLDEFRAWYRVEQQVANRRPRRPTPTEADVQKAYEIYVMCSCDFY